MALRETLGTLRRFLLPAAARLSSPGVRQVSATIVCNKADLADDFGPDPAESGAKGGWGQTKVKDVLAAKPNDQGAWLWCSKDDLVIDAVRKMTKGNVGSLLVFDPSKIQLSSQQDLSKMKSASGDAVVGIITERDYLTKVVVKGKNSKELNVSEIMTPQPKLMTVSPKHSVLEVMRLMVKNNFRHVPVVEGDQYLGMVSIRDTVNVMVQEHREEVGRLQEYITGSY